MGSTDLANSRVTGPDPLRAGLAPLTRQMFGAPTRARATHHAILGVRRCWDFTPGKLGGW
jgi:hypothetical protein